MKKNILVIAHEPMLNGASKSLLDIMDELKDKCNFIVIVAYDYGLFLDELIKRDLKVYYVTFERWVKIKDDNFKKEKNQWEFKDNKKNQILAKKMAEILKDERIDLIYSNTSVVDLGYRISKILKLPHVWHIREFGEDDFSMYPLCSNRKYYKVIGDKNNTLICISQEVAKKFIGKVKKDKINIIYNGVDKKNINDNKKFTKKETEKLICIQVGMINKAKGQEITIKAIDELQKEGYKQIELWIAGSGNIEDLGIKDVDKKKWLKLLGQVNNIEKIREKVNIEIVSSKKEGFGRVTIEAMMGQIPVIGTNSGGTKELIRDNENGLLYTAGDYIELKEKIKYFCENRKEIERMGKNAYKYSKDYFQIERCAKEVFEVFEKVSKK